MRYLEYFTIAPFARMSELEETTLVSIRSSLGKITSFMTVYNTGGERCRGWSTQAKKGRWVGGGERKEKERHSGRRVSIEQFVMHFLL